MIYLCGNHAIWSLELFLHLHTGDKAICRNRLVVGILAVHILHNYIVVYTSILDVDVFITAYTFFCLRYLTSYRITLTILPSQAEHNDALQQSILGDTVT